MLMSRHIVPVRRKQVNEKVSTIILSGNTSYRMNIYGTKCLFKIGNKFLINYQIEAVLKKFSDVDFVLVIGDECDKVIKNKPKNVRIVENQLYYETNEVEQLRLALNNIITDKVLIIGGDVLFDHNLISDININESSILIGNTTNNSKNDIGVTIVNKKATILNYNLPTKWSYIAYFTGEELKLLNSLCSDKARSKMFFSEIINTILEYNPMKVIESFGKTTIINTREELENINENFNRK